jgi:hypothetical protein
MAHALTCRERGDNINSSDNAFEYLTNLLNILRRVQTFVK